ncbi:MAG: cytochrome c peroxidase [Bacteroidota bacterium]
MFQSIRIQKGPVVALLILVSACERDQDVPTADVESNGLSALPTSPVYPSTNAYSQAKFDLGRALFWDPILSGNNDVACATCHHPDFGYSDGRQLSSGVNGNGLGPARTGGALVKRNSPTVINTAFNGINELGVSNPSTAPMFWDNRAESLEAQAILPLLSAEEMRGDDIPENEIYDHIVQKLVALGAYEMLFQNAFGNDLISIERVADALSTFQREIVANDSPFDEYMRGNTNALNNQEIEGMNTFIDVGCANCHSGPMFSDFELHTLSVPEHPLVEDEGATGNFDFRTPSLRNLALTGPYMHNGRFNQLRDVLEFYNDISGGNGDSQNPNVNDNEIAQEARDLDLDGGDINEIIQFLNALNDEDFDREIPQSVPSGLPVGGNIN